MIDFLTKISWNWKLIIEYNKNCNSNLKEFSYKEIISKFPDKENIYFCSWIIDKTQNRSKKNIWLINRFSIDIDLRKNVWEITDEEIIEEWINLWDFLKNERPYDFWQWSYIVFSWNWLHLHYLWNIFEVPKYELFSEYYKESTEHIYKEFNNFMWDIFLADYKVWDLWHLFRLPWTFNIKEWIKKECKIIAIQYIESDFVNKLPELIELAKKRIEYKNNQYIIESQKKKITPIYTENNIFETIREKVDVAQVLMKFAPERTLQKDLKNFKKPWKKWNNSYFVDREHNLIIRNWSTFLAGSKEWMNPIDIVEEYTGFKWKELLQWFKTNKFIT